MSVIEIFRGFKIAKCSTVSSRLRISSWSGNLCPDSKLNRPRIRTTKLRSFYWMRSNTIATETKRIGVQTPAVVTLTSSFPDDETAFFQSRVTAWAHTMFEGELWNDRFTGKVVDSKSGLKHSQPFEFQTILNLSWNVSILNLSTKLMTGCFLFGLNPSWDKPDETFRSFKSHKYRR